jgi:hypothetical protein
VGIIKTPDPIAQPTAIDHPRQKPISLPELLCDRDSIMVFSHF